MPCKHNLQETTSIRPLSGAVASRSALHRVGRRASSPYFKRAIHRSPACPARATMQFVQRRFIPPKAASWDGKGWVSRARQNERKIAVDPGRGETMGMRARGQRDARLPAVIPFSGTGANESGTIVELARGARRRSAGPLRCVASPISLLGFNSPGPPSPAKRALPF